VEPGQRPVERFAGEPEIGCEVLERSFQHHGSAIVRYSKLQSEQDALARRADIAQLQPLSEYVELPGHRMNKDGCVASTLFKLNEQGRRR
jgi:hypothetical protein